MNQITSASILFCGRPSGAASRKLTRMDIPPSETPKSRDPWILELGNMTSLLVRV